MPRFDSGRDLFSFLRRRKPARHRRFDSIEVLEARIAPAAVISATTTKTFFVDADADGKADPGLDTIQYKVTISNTGDAGATNVSYNDTIDPNTTLFGAVLKSPLAVAQSYPNAVGNTVLTVAAGAGLKTNVHDLDGLTSDTNLQVAAGTFTTSDGGSVVVAADGSFTYTPVTGHQNLTDTFTYTVTDSDGLQGTGTASIALGARVWYVDNAFGGTSDGSSLKPYKQLSDISGAAGSDTAGDILFLKQRATPYDGNLTLLDNQHVYGGGATLIVNGVTINSAGASTALTTTTAATDTITLASAATATDIHGFTLGNTAAGATGTAIKSSGASFGTLTVDNTVINTTGVALSLNNGTFAGAGFSSTTAKSISLTTVGGAVTLGSGALSTTAGDAFFVSGGGANIDYSGTITEGASGTGHSVDIVSKTGGTVNLTGAISDSGTGILLSSNTGATFHFAGGLTASTGANKAFSATGGGTIDITGANNTLATTTATALEVLNTGISASGLTFKSVSAGTSAGSAGDGINLDTTGALGGLTITGSGTAGSGGVIQHKTGADGSTTSGIGIHLSNTVNVSLARMQLNDFDNYGIQGTNVTGFTLTNSTVNGSVGTLQGGIGEGDVYFTGLSGSATVTSSAFTGAAYDAFHVFNDSAQTLSRLTITNSNFAMTNTSGNDAVGLQATNGTFNVTFQSNTITAARGDLFQLNLLGTVTSDLVFGGATSALGNTLTNNNTNIVSGGGGFTLGGGGPTNNITLTYNISHNTISGSHGAVIAVTKGTGTGGSLTGTIDSNVIGTQGVNGSGSTQGEGIAVFHDGAGSSNTTITNNHVSGVVASRGAIDVFVHNGAGGTMTAVVQGNTIDTLDQANSFAGMYIQTGSNPGASGDNNKSNLTIGGAGALRNTITLGANASSALVAGITLEQEGVSKVGLIGSPNYTGAPYDYTAVQNYVAANNTGTFTNGQAVFAFGDAVKPAGAGYFGGAQFLIFAPEPPAAHAPAPTATPTPTPTASAAPVTPPAAGAPAPATVPPQGIADDGVLNQAELDSLVGAAIARWEATGLTPAQDAILHSVTFSVDELPGWYLGEATPGHITLDATAAGNRWFIDSTPMDDSEYAGTGTQLQAPIGVASGRVDALTTVMHELGHQLGLDDTYSVSDTSSLMYGYMHLGERRLPGAHQADGADAHHLTQVHGPDFAIGPVTIGTLDAGSSVQVQYRASVNYPFPATGTPTINDQGTVTYNTSSTVQPTVVSTQVDLPGVNVATVSGTAAEGTGALSYTFTRTGFTGADLTVSFTAGGTAAFTNDYTATSSGPLNFAAGTLVIPAGSSSATLTLTPVDDRLVEGPETVSLTVASAPGYNPTGTPGGGTINDNDTATVSFTAGTSTALESVGTQNVGVTLTLNTIGTGTIGLGSNFTANLTATGGTALGSGTDYTLPGSPAVSFLPTDDFSSGSVTKNAAVTIVDDRQVEGAETALFGLAIVQNIGTQVSIGGTTAHTLTINDNDTATLGFTLGSSTALESVGTQNVGVTLTLNTIGTGTIGLASNLTANLTSTGGTALGGGTDYTLPGTPAVTFLAGTYASGSGTQSAAVTVTDDRQVEGDETAQLGLSIVGNIGTQVSLGGTGTHTLTITDNDTALVGFSAASSTVAEGAGSQNVTVLLTINAIGTGTIGLASNLTANLTTTGGTATGGGVDYTLPGSPAVTFLAGTYASGTGTQIAAVGIVDDNLSEATETAQLGLSIVQNIGTQASIAGTTTHTLSITDNDPLPTISISSVTQAEGNTGNSPATSFTFNVSLSAVSGQTVTVHYSTTDGTATSPADFTAIGDTVLTFLPGDLTKTVTVLVNGDTITEPNEQFTLNLSNATAATILSGTGTGTIVDDDASLHAALDVSGNLTISDISSTGVDNALTVLLVNSGASLQISDLTQVFDGVPTTTPASVLSNGGKTLTIPASAFTGNLALNTAGGNDTVTLDLTGGNFIHAGGVDYAGGNPTVAPGDKLIITGGAQGLVTYNHTNAHDGSIVMSTIGTVRYTGLEPIINSGTATDVVFNLPATDDLVTLGDNGSTPTDGLLRLSSSPVTFEQVDFAIPTGTLKINLGAGNDTLTVAATPQLTAGLTINGDLGDDTINLNGGITFGLNKNLDVNLQDDSATPGIDVITVGAGANYVLTGTGTALLKASKNIVSNGNGRIATENGALNAEANQQATPTVGTFVGVSVAGTFESTGTGIVTVLGHGGDTGSANNGVSILTGGLIRGGSTGDSTIVTGTGGAASGGSNVGVHVNGGIVQSIGGNILITGVGGAAGASGNGGIGMLNGGQVLGGTNGNVILTGTKGAGTGNDIALATTGSTVTSSGTGNISLFADSLLIGTSGTTINAGTNTVFLLEKTSGTLINIGSAGGPSNGLLEIANAEFNRITAGTVQVGDANSGAITITAVISPLAYKTLSIGNAASFTSSGGFASDVNSATDYEKMLVAGALAIDPLAILSVTSAVYVPTASDAFIIINNTSAGTTTGAFNGKAEGSTVVVNGTNEQITYIGGAGSNDVILQGTTIAVTVGTTPVLESSTTGLVYTFTRVGDLTVALPVNFTAGGTATNTADYTATSSATTFNYAAGTFTMPAGVSTVTVTLVPVDDRIVEGSETAVLTVAAGSGYGVAGSPATGTIADNDTVTLTFTAGTSTALESVGTQNIGATITINAIGTGPIMLASNLTANLTTTGGNATGSGTDYTLPASPGVTFAAGTYATGTATQNFGLAVTDDRLVEGTETAVLGLAIAQNIGTQVSIGGTTAHTLTITDNDTATIGFTLGTSTALESVGTQNIGTTLTINAIGTGTIGLATDLTANLTTTGGTATGGGTDYTLPGSPAVTFLAGTYATGTGTQNSAVTITDDRLVEGSETAQLGLSIVQNIGTQVSVGGTTAHTLTITDNDTATLGFTLGTSTALESVGTQNIQTTLTINAIGTGTIGLASNLTADLTTTGGTATGSGTDYTLPGSPAVTFLAGTYATGTATQNAAVTITDDRLVEGTETAGLGLSIVGNIGTQVSLGGTTAHTLTITDNDTATLGFTLGTSSALESVGTQNIGTTLTINAIGSGTIGLASNLTANLTTTGGTANGGGTDYTLPGTPAVTFLAGTYATGTATQNAAVSITDDRLVEGDETAGLGLSIVTNIGAQVSLGGTTAHTLTITDNDTATLSFTSGTSTALESVGTQNISTTLTLNTIGIGPIGLASNLTANLTATGGTATGGGTDYTLPGSPAVTFLAGTYATGTATQNAAVSITDDRLVEGSETAGLGLSIVQNIGTQVSLGGTTAHTLTITDNDTATLGFTLGTSTALESAGTQNIQTTLTINAIGIGTIGLASNLTADLTTTGGTATGSGTDYTLPGSPAVTFLAGTYATGTATQNAAVTITDDRLVEGTETAGLGLSIVGNIGTQVSVGGTTAHTLTITDNDTATLGFTLGTSSALESVGTQNIGTTLTINAIGTGPIGLASNLTANLTTTGGTANGGGTDYTLPGTPAVTFLAGTYATGTATQNAAVSITDDRLVEGDETAGLGLSIVGNIGTQVSLGGTTAHTLTITDNDTATLSFTSGTSTALESVGTQNISTTLTLNTIGTGPIGLASNLTANLTSTGGTATGGGTDYTLPGSPAVTFLAGTYATGTATQNGAVNVTDDRLVEGDETAQLGLSIVGNIGTQVSIGGTTAHTFTITDNDTATLGFTAGTSTALESVGTQNIGTTLTINAIGTGPIGLASDLTVNLTTTGGTATGGGTDYTLPAVTFLAGTYATGTATQNAGVAITDDRLVEGTETAQLGLSITGNIGAQVSVAGTTAHTLTITDNDTAALTLTAGTSAAVEGDGTHDIGVILTINAIGSGPIGLASALTADLTTTGGTATNGGIDYTLPASPAIVFLAGTYATGTGTQIAVVGITDDRLVEGTETAQLALGITGNIGTQVSLGGTTAHTLTINDNDTATIGFVTPTSSVTEGTPNDPIGLVLTINATGTGPIALAHDVTFNVTTTGGTATGGGVDYTLPGSVTFSAGAQSGDTKTANLAITDDSIVEDVETANLGLSIANDGSGGQITVATDATASHVTSITDNDIDLHVSGTHPDVSIVAGSGLENLTYTFTVQNNGFVDAHNLTLDEAFTLPAGTTLSSDSETIGTFDGTHWVLPTLAASGSATLTLNLTADHSTAHNAIATVVSAVASANESVVNTGDDSDLESATIIRQNDLSVNITDAPDPAAPNAGLTYTITVANAGPSDSTSGHLTDNFPAGLNAITWTADFSNNGGTGNAGGSGNINENLSIPAGGSVVYTVHATPDISIAGTTIMDTATISSSEDTNSMNDSFTESTFIGGVDLHLSKTADAASQTPGQVIKYTLAYHNGGFVTAAGVKISDLIPANTEFDLANSAAGWTDAMGNPLANNAPAGTEADFSVGNLAVSNTDATVVFAVHVKPTVSAGAETIDNSATIADNGASGPDTKPADNTATASSTLVAAPDLVLTSDADASLIIRGQTLHTMYHYSNVGNQDAADTTITATVPVGTHFNSLDSNPSWSQLDATHYEFDIASLPAGAAPGTVVFAVDVDTTRVAGLHEVDTTANIDDGGVNGPDPTPANNTATNASALTKIYEGIYAVSQGIAVAGRFGTPTVHVYDPIDGHELYHFDAYESKLRASVRVAVADINGDGFDDIITTIGTGTGRLRVFDGLNGTWLHDEASYKGAFKNEIAVFDGVKDKGAFVAAGDLNGDGHADIAVGSALGGGKVRVFDGLTGAARTFGTSDTFFQPFGKTFKGGVRVAVGDVLGDSHADLEVGEGYYGAEVKVYDGNALNGPRPTVAGGVVPPPAPVAAIDFKVGAKTYRGGVSVGLGDLNHDGKLDLIIGRNSGRPTVVEAFSGLLKDGNGNPLAIGSAIDPFDKNPMRPTYALGVRVAAIDINFDGVADIIAASGGNNKSTVNIYDGVTHELLRAFTALPETPNSSLFVAGTAVAPVYHPVMAP